MSLLAQSQQWYPTHVKVVVIRARGLRTKGKDGTNDAYAIMQLGKEQYSSSVAEKTTAPQWREEAEFEMPPLQPGRADKSTLRLTVMHRALVGLDKFLGQAAISLSELYAKKTRSKVGWYRLHSKTGKVDKERGEIEADIQFVRNNMTASMFDLSAKDKSRSALGKLKDRLKGKKRDGFSDSASAIVPSLGAVGDSDEEDEEAARAATTSRLRKLLPKSTLQRTSLSQSMSVIPTAPSSPPGNASPGGFTEIRLDDSAGEESSGKGLQVPTIVSHKRAASTDNTQLDLALPGNPRKEPLSLFGGLRPKSDPVSQSNLCINGSHVYTEEPSQAVPSKPRPEPRSRFYAPSPEEDPRPETPPRATADTPGPASAERGVGSPDPGVGRARPAPEERVQSLNPFEANEEEEEQVGSGEAMPEEPRPQAKKEEAGRGGLMSLFPKKTEAPKALEGKELRRTSEEGRGEVKKPASTSVWANRMAAIKPKPHPVKPMTAAEPKIHDVSSEENLKARLKVVDTVVTRPATGQAVTFGERLTSPKDCDPSDPAAAYSLLTHDELIQLVLKQKEIISKKDCHVQELENYIDNLLVRVMEETPNILRVSYQPPRKAERV